MVYGSKGVLRFYGELLSLPHSIPAVSEVPDEPGVYLKETVSEVRFEVGKVSKESGEAQFAFLKSAVEDAKRGQLGAIVTLPINKEAIRFAGFNFPGHTEYLAYSFQVKDFAMMLANRKLKVVLLTTHLPLKEVPEKVKKEAVLEKLLLIERALPGSRIAVCGLNPHAGEGGLFGREELEEISPAVEEARSSGIEVSGPYPADTVFNRALSGEFDVVLAMYHDQGLIPVKLTGFGKSVNVTLGLPVVRTSVDHGTAYDIAGKGVADTGSFREAVKLALELRSQNHSL